MLLLYWIFFCLCPLLHLIRDSRHISRVRAVETSACSQLRPSYTTILHCKHACMSNVSVSLTVDTDVSFRFLSFPNQASWKPLSSWIYTVKLTYSFRSYHVQYLSSLSTAHANIPAERNRSPAKEHACIGAWSGHSLWSPAKERN
jgi:hypothetical protein